MRHACQRITDFDDSEYSDVRGLESYSSRLIQNPLNFQRATIPPPQLSPSRSPWHLPSINNRTPANPLPRIIIPCRSSAGTAHPRLCSSWPPLPSSPQNSAATLSAPAGPDVGTSSEECAMATVMAAANGSGGDTKAAFAEIYDKLKQEMLEDPSFEFTDESLQWIDRVMLPSPSLRLLI
ncbi:hypothetical protein PR202_gb05053 [Eleusine coracana subsp. coracana]|uniref:Uncharacterized protein n=1 Tax=Eleusine coracana subsp. coracana TaxID=191504 RepID=A0AAV5E5L8_ELECO|nr:hypothetical protein PR202_gb05053 [Eleusine coracana subsp. coracana]